MRIRLARLAAATALPLALASCSFLQGLFGSDDGTEDGSGEASSSAEAVSVAISEPTTVRTIKSSGSLTLTVSLESAGDVYFVFTNSSLGSYADEPGVEPSASSARSSAAGGTAVARTTPGSLGLSGPPPAGRPPRGAPEVTDRNAELRDELRGGKAEADPYGAARSVSGSASFEVDEAALGSVGDVRDFYDYETVANAVPVTLRYVSGATATAMGERALRVWVADDCWDDDDDSLDGDKSLLVSQAMTDAYAGKFLLGEAGTDNDIYDWVTKVLGAEWGDVGSSSLIGFDGVIDIVLLDIDDDGSTTGGVLGYFYGRDNLVKGSGASYSAYSNEMVCFAIDAVMLASAGTDGVETSGDWSLEGSYWPRELVSTLAHEFQHMISFYQNLDDDADDTWAEEMMSMCVEDLVADKILADGPRGVAYDDYSAGLSGNGSGRLPLFVYYPDSSLTNWDSSSDSGQLISYSSSYAFGAWLMRQYGAVETLRAVEDQASVDSDGVLAAARELSGDSDLDFGDLLAAWGAAVLVSDDSGRSAPYRYDSGASSGKPGFSSTEADTTYSLGDINMYNYTYTYTAGGQSASQAGPWINVDGPTYYGAIYPSSNAFYLAAEGLSGTGTWTIDLPEGVYLTVVIK